MLDKIARKLRQLDPERVMGSGGKMVDKPELEISRIEKFTEDESDLFSALYDDSVQFYQDETGNQDAQKLESIARKLRQL